MLMTTDQMIGETVHSLLWRAHRTQTDLATKLGLTQSSVSHKLRGRRPFFAAELLEVSRFLDVSIDALYGLDVQTPRPDGDPVGASDVRLQGLEPRTRWLTILADQAA